MNILFKMFLMLAFTLQSRGYHDVVRDTSVIKGTNGKNYELTIYPSKETAKERSQQEVLEQQYNRLNENLQQHFSNQQPHLYQSKALSSIAETAQDSHNQFTNNLNNQQLQQFNLQHQQQEAIFLKRASEQQQYFSQQFEFYPKRLTCISKPPNDKYLSQSEASQLDVPYKQINGNPRPFKRIIVKCDTTGQCEAQNSTDCHSGGIDFHHQQVLKLSKAQIEPSADEFENKLQYQFMGNALTSLATKALKGISIKGGADMKDRRLFPYSEIVIPQYPHN